MFFSLFLNCGVPLFLSFSGSGSRSSFTASRLLFGQKYLDPGTAHYTTLHYTTLHYTTLHYTTLHCLSICLPVCLFCSLVLSFSFRSFVHVDGLTHSLCLSLSVSLCLSLSPPQLRFFRPFYTRKISTTPPKNGFPLHFLRPLSPARAARYFATRRPISKRRW